MDLAQQEIPDKFRGDCRGKAPRQLCCGSRHPAFPDWRFAPGYPTSAKNKLSSSLWAVSTAPRMEGWVLPPQGTSPRFPITPSLERIRGQGSCTRSSPDWLRVLSLKGVRGSPVRLLWNLTSGLGCRPLGRSLLAPGVLQAPPLLQEHHPWQGAQHPHQSFCGARGDGAWRSYPAPSGSSSLPGKGVCETVCLCLSAISLQTPSR